MSSLARIWWLPIPAVRPQRPSGAGGILETPATTVLVAQPVNEKVSVGVTEPPCAFAGRLAGVW